MFISRDLICASCGNVQDHLIDRKKDEEHDYSEEEPCHECGDVTWYRTFSIPHVRTRTSSSYIDGGVGRSDRQAYKDYKKSVDLDKKAANMNKDSVEYKESKREARRLRTIKKS